MILERSFDSHIDERSVSGTASAPGGVRLRSRTGTDASSAGGNVRGVDAKVSAVCGMSTGMNEPMLDPGGELPMGTRSSVGLNAIAAV